LSKRKLLKLANNPSANYLDRFCGRSDFYSRYRPRYPVSIITALKREIAFDSSKIVADIGSGTGLLAEVFLQNGNKVVGVEPNPEMRSAGEDYLSSYSNFVSVAGSAENTGLEYRTFDLITAGQALHWFDMQQAVKEFVRILKPSGHVAIVYNERRKDTGLMSDYQRLINKYERNRAKVPEIDDSYLSRFFGKNKFRSLRLANSQILDLEGLEGRASSSSYLPKPNDPTYIEMQKDLSELFQKYQEGGRVKLAYDTSLIIGTLRI
jgi:SAM-dependent methyltransferase